MVKRATIGTWNLPEPLLRAPRHTKIRDDTRDYLTFWLVTVFFAIMRAYAETWSGR
jgi:hypothetical protein